MIIWFSMILLGLAVGLLSSFLGLGGGVIIVPLLPMLVPLSVREVFATSLFTVFLVASTNAFRFLRRGQVELTAALILGVFSAVAAFAASKITAFFSPKVLLAIVTLVLLTLATVCLLFRRIKITPSYVFGGRTRKLVLAVVGLFTGLIAGFSGVGGGSITGPLMIILRLVDHRKLAAIGNTAMILTASFGAWGFVDFGQAPSWPQWGLIHLNLGLLIWAGSLMTSQIGLHHQHRMSEHARTGLLAGVLLLLALKVGISAYKC